MTDHNRDWRLRRHDAPLAAWIYRQSCIGRLAFDRFHGRACDLSSTADINQLCVCRMLARARVRARWEAER